MAELSRYGLGGGWFGSLASRRRWVVVRERGAASGHTMTLQPTPPASVRWRLVCRREYITRLAESGSFVALRPACGYRLSNTHRAEGALAGFPLMMAT